MWRSFHQIPRNLRCWTHGVRSAPTSARQDEELKTKPPTLGELVPCVLGSHTRRSGGRGQDSHQWHGCDFRFQDFWARHSTQTAIGWGTAVIIGLQLTQFWQLKHRQARRESASESQDYCPLVTVVYRLAQALPGGHNLPKYVLGSNHWAVQDPNKCRHSSSLLEEFNAEETPLDTGQNDLDTGQLDGLQTTSRRWQSVSQRIQLPSDLLHSCGLLCRDDSHLHFGGTQLPQNWWTPTLQPQSPPEEPDPNNKHILSKDCDKNNQNKADSTHSFEAQNAPQKSDHDASPSTCTLCDETSTDAHRAAFTAAVHNLVELTTQYMTRVELGHGYNAARTGDLAKALTCWRQLSASGCPVAHYNLGVCYEHGRGVARDIHKAAEHYKEAAAGGHAQAAYNLACMLLQGTALQSDSTQAAVDCLKKAADSGLAQAQRELGVLYTEPKSRDLLKAAHYFDMAAQQKDSVSQYYLGVCYEHGWGVPCNEARAADLYAQAAKTGHAEAKYNLAVFFEQGLGGLPEDAEAALELYRGAQEGGVHSAKESVQRLEDKLNQQEREQELRELQSLHRGLKLSRQQSRSSPTFGLSHSPPVVSQSQMSIHEYLSRHLSMALDQWHNEPLQNDLPNSNGPVKFIIGDDLGVDEGLGLEEPRMTHSTQLGDLTLVACP